MNADTDKAAARSTFLTMWIWLSAGALVVYPLSVGPAVFLFVILKKYNLEYANSLAIAITYSYWPISRLGQWGDPMRSVVGGHITFWEWLAGG